MKKTILKDLLLVAVIGLLIFGGFKAYAAYTQPLSEPLSLVQPDVKSPMLDATPAADKTCGNTGSILILFTGADYSSGVWPFGADTVRLIKVDFDNQEITSIAFPRDLVVKVSGIAPENQGDQRLGLAYYYEEQATPGDDKAKILAGTQLIADILVEDFEVTPEHYITLELKSLQDLFDLVGDVEINNPTAFVSDYGVSFPAGVQTLTPQLAVEYVRTSEPGNEIDRLNRQNIYLKAFRNKVLSLKMIPQIPDLLKQFDEVITTDLSPNLLVNLACMAEKVPEEKIYYYNVDGNLIITGEERGDILPVYDQIIAFLKEKLGTN